MVQGPATTARLQDVPEILRRPYERNFRVAIPLDPADATGFVSDQHAAARRARHAPAGSRSGIESRKRACSGSQRRTWGSFPARK